VGLYRSPTGAIESIDDDKASSALASGYVPVTSAQSGAPVESDATGGILGTLNAGATSVLSGATLGLSDVALRGILNRGDMRRLAADREANPIVSGAGQVAGAILPSLVAPGSILGQAPAGVLSRATAPLVERGGLSALAAGGIEGAAQNAGAYLSDVALGNRDLSAEGIAGAVGGGFAFGVGGGVVAMGIEKGTMAARRMFARVADGGERAANEAEQAWMTQYQATIEAHDAAVNAAKAQLAAARAAREDAALARNRAAATTAETRINAPQIDAERASAQAFDELAAKEAAIKAAELPPVKVGNIDDLERLIFGQQEAKSELDDLMRQVESPAVETAPVGEVHEPETVKSNIPDYSTIKDYEKKFDDYLEQTIPARSIAERGYYEPPGREGIDSVRMRNARKAISEGQRDAIKLGVSEDGKVVLSDGRHRLQAAIESDSPVKVKWFSSSSPASHDVLRTGEIVKPAMGSASYDAYKSSFVKGLSKEEIDAAKAYSGGSHASINRAIENQAEMSAKNAENTRLLDSLISRSSLPEDMTVFRGIQSDEIFDKYSKLNPGDVFSHGRFTSTTASDELPREFYGNVEMRIKLHKGDHAAPIPALKSQERELLLPRDQKFKLTSLQNFGGKRLIVNVEAVNESSNLEYLLRGTSERVASGESLKSIGAPSAAEYAANKSTKSEAASRAFRERAAFKERAGIGSARRSYKVKQLEIAHDAAIDRAATAIDPAERATATYEANAIEQQLAIAGRASSAPDDIARLAPAIEKYERKSAELTEGLGEAAPQTAREHAAAFRAAEDEADRKVTDRATRAVDDSVHPPTGKGTIINPQDFERVFGKPMPLPPTSAEALASAKQDQLASSAAYKRAKATETEAKINARRATDARKAIPERPKAIPPVPREASTLGSIATAIGVAGELGIPGIPKPEDIPVIGPLLGAYIKYRAIKATAGRFVGRVAATGDTRAAALAARTKDKIVTAVDRTLGLAEKAAPKARAGIVASSAVIGKRIFDDGEPDAPKGATRQEQAAVRIREILAANQRPELITAMVRHEMRNVVDPDLVAAAEKHLIARFAHLASVVPKPPPDNAYAQRPWVPSMAATHELEQRLAVIHDPSHALSGPVSPAAADTFREAHPQLYQLAKDRLIDRVSDLKEPMPREDRLRASALFQIPIDISLDPSHIAIVRAPIKPDVAPSMANVPDLSSMYNPQNTRIKL
jgi:hypothetical protein